MLKLPVPEAKYENVVLKPSEYRKKWYCLLRIERKQCVTAE